MKPRCCFRLVCWCWWCWCVFQVVTHTGSQVVFLALVRCVLYGRLSVIGIKFRSPSSVCVFTSCPFILHLLGCLVSSHPSLSFLLLPPPLPSFHPPHPPRLLGSSAPLFLLPLADRQLLCHETVDKDEIKWVSDFPHSLLSLQDSTVTDYVM